MTRLLTSDLLSAAEALRVWASSRPYVGKIWIYGSRARGQARCCSDLDVAIEIDPVANDEDAYTSVVCHRQQWIRELAPSMPYTLDLEWYGHQPVKEGVDRDGILVFERDFNE